MKGDSAPSLTPWEKFLEGGEMGALMRAKDWSTTPLGPVAGWPQSLRTAVSAMLAAPQPSYIFWGSELAILYNDRGLPFVGQKHPDCLGHTIRVVLKEAWPVLGPLVEGVMKTGVPVYLENLLIPLERVGFLQDGYFTFSYIPLRNEAAEVGGILVIVNETTGQVVGARRLALIRELSLRAALCQTVESVLHSAEQALAEAPIDLPFALLYELRGERAHLVVRAGIERGLAASPVELRRHDSSGWPLFDVARDKVELLVDDLTVRFAGLPGGPSGEAAMRALILPLAGDVDGAATHVLVAGLNPRYLFDDDARSFLQLLGRQIVTSIASARALEEKTERAAQLAELDRQKTEFFSNVSHEFRTPLTLMLGPVEDALEQKRGIGGDDLASVHRNALRLLKLVNNLLDFSRAEAGRARAAYRPTNLSQLTIDLASGFRSAIEAAGVRYEILCTPSEEPILVDVEMWEKIVLNLLSNAFKFTFEGKIAVTLHHEEDEAVLSVSDTGVGIPSEELPHLFDRFHRVQGARSRTHEGSGIGLALVADLTRLHGGAVEVESRVGEGTRFTVKIPRRSAQVAEPSSEAAPTQASRTTKAAYVEEALRWVPNAVVVTAPSADPHSGAAAGARAARILVAEDNADMRGYLTRLLSERWTVETASDGSQALAQAFANVPDAIVSDMMMPGLDGLALVRELRKDERTREVPFLLLSARADQQSTMDALAQGVSDYMVKPFSARELMARVAAQLEIAAVQRASRQRLESFLMDAPAAIAVVRGPSHVFVLANKRYEEIVGRRGLVGKAGRVALPELVEQGVWDLFDRVYATGEPFLADSFLAQLARGEGGALQEAFFNWVAQPTRGSDGAIDGVMIFAVEVTEQVRARQKLERASAIEQTLRSEAVAANRAKDEFLAMLGHELRNPLAPISTALQLMQLRGSEVGEKERRVIERQVKHLEGLVGDLLDVSRIAQGKFDLNRTRVELSAVLTDAIEMASTLLEQRHHRLDIRVASTGLPVDGDIGRLKQVFANLITNAAKYTEPNGHIWIEAQRHDDVIVVEVRDSGVGITAEMLPRIFELFSQVPQSLARSQGGLGLGLSIVRSIVRMHGGQVHAQSEGAGKGSTFVVQLPAATGVGPVVSRDSSLSIKRGRRGEGKAQRILIVDDNVDAAELLSEMLRTEGHTTHIAHDGLQALRAVTEFRPTVALLDIGLPVMDGYELAVRLRSDPGLRGVRLIAITGYGQQADRERSEQAGFDAHLVKPVAFDALSYVLNERDN